MAGSSITKSGVGPGPDFHLFTDAPKPDGWVVLTGQIPPDPDAPGAGLATGVIAQPPVVQDRGNLTEFEPDDAEFNDTCQSYSLQNDTCIWEPI